MPLAAVHAQTGSVSANLDWAKKKCAELGFKAGTERFGNCVLQLSRDDARPMSSTPVPAQVPTPPSGPATAVHPVSVTVTTFKDCDDCPEMVRIPAGTFLMGSKADPFARFQPSADEQPQHQVTLKAFAMGKYEVTQEQWYAVMGNLPSSTKGRTLPVDSVSWDDAQEFVRRLSAKTGKNYRLPSEAEWEYAARAGSRTEWYFGDNENELGRYAWFSGNSGNSTHPVGEKLPNAFGLHDVHGNVREWTADCWNDNYNAAPSDGSAWLAGNCSRRVLRGGSWRVAPPDLRSASRYWLSASSRDDFIGFRVSRTD
jgi:formylglycine-generating enzyme required for sulfatase activity